MDVKKFKVYLIVGILVLFYGLVAFFAGSLRGYRKADTRDRIESGYSTDECRTSVGSVSGVSINSDGTARYSDILQQDSRRRDCEKSKEIEAGEEALDRRFDDLRISIGHLRDYPLESAE
jgi:hypothetical protein